MSKETKVSNVRALRSALSQGYDVIYIEGALADKFTKKIEREQKKSGYTNAATGAVLTLTPVVIITIAAIVGGIVLALTFTALMRDYDVEFGYDKHGKQGYWKATKKGPANVGTTEAAAH